MNKLSLLMAAALLTGCATASAPPPVSQGPGPATPPVQAQPVVAKAPVVPAESEVCLKPDDQSGITFGIYPPQSDGDFRAKPGWTIARPATQVIGSVAFPKAVDPASVKLTVEPAADWVYREQPTTGGSDSAFSFNFLPAGGNMAEPLNRQWGKPGWITLTVQSARAKDGSDLVPKPVSLKIYAYSLEMQDTHPYLVKCYSSLEVSPGPNGH